MSPSITRAERDVLNTLIEGKTNKEMAQILICEPQSIKNHLTTLYSKFGVNNRTQLAVKWWFVVNGGGTIDDRRDNRDIGRQGCIAEEAAA